MKRQRISKILVAALGLVLFTASHAAAGTYPSGDWRSSRAICASGSVDVSQIWSEGSEVWIPGWIEPCQGADLDDATWGFVAFIETESYQGQQFGYRGLSRYNFNVLVEFGDWEPIKALCQASSPTRRLSCFKITMNWSGATSYLTFSPIETNDPILDVPYKHDRIPPDPDCPTCI